MTAEIIIAIIILAPALGSILAGFFSRYIKLAGVNIITIGLVGLSFIGSLYLAWQVFATGVTYEVNYFTWAVFENYFSMDISFTVDSITVYMMLIVTFVSLLVHIYSMGYLKGDPGYARFYGYISGFTFAMLCLVMGNNFLLLFFGWEGVGLFSYLLIGFWFDKETANAAALRAFIANRVGDLGFLLGIAAIVYYFNAIDYQTVFQAAKHLDNDQVVHFLGMSFSPITLICTLLFVGAIGKSAQVPLHIWLEGSMQGPTPISALIHAATMVTAGVFMVGKLSPLFVLSPAALSFVMIIGGITCLFMGLIAIVENDIKYVIAYCTLSQLGYMMTAMGAGAFSIGMFHLLTHAMFKALLFLSAGSVIIAMHHDQDMRNMGGLRRYMPITYIGFLIGAWALSALPPFSGFFSKDLIIESAAHTTVYGHTFPYILVLLCAFVTSFYTFRMFFMTFHGKPRMSESVKSGLKESPWSVLIPLIALSIPAAGIGFVLFNWILSSGTFGHSVTPFLQPALGNQTVTHLLASEPSHQSSLAFILNAYKTIPFWLALSALVLAYVIYVWYPKVTHFFTDVRKGFGILYYILVKKYFINGLYDFIFGPFMVALSKFFWYVIDILMIDRLLVHGSARLTYLTGWVLKKAQRGYVFDYVLTFILGLLALLVWLVVV